MERNASCGLPRAEPMGNPPGRWTPWVLDTRMAKKKGPGRPEPEVSKGHKRVVSFMDGLAYAISGSTGSRITLR